MSNNQTAQGGASNSKAYLILIIGIMAVAFSAPWVKQSNFEPATSVILRVGIGLLFLLPFFIMEIKKIGKINKTGVILSLVAGLFLGIDFTAWNYSIYFVGSGIASILLNLQIIILPALAFLFDRERIPKSFFIVAPIMILGVLMTGGIFDSAEATDGPTTAWGMNLAVLGTIAGSISGVCYGAYLYTSRKASRVNGIQIVQPMFFAGLTQLIAPAIVMLFSGRGFDLTHGVLVDGMLPMNPETALGDPITGMNWFWMIVLASIGQAVAWTFIQYGAIRLDPTIVAGLLLLSPISTVSVIAVILFGEIPSTIQIAGVILILLAVAYQNNLHKVLLGKKPKGESSPGASS
ncbi:DMT family transporter [Sporosarcina sp. UB5]|uniref:DMT family transporter n=1 Tax=Sporosarcina sp. UB5 TaxID=3047463 RepID=UPI003D799E9E